MDARVMDKRFWAGGAVPLALSLLLVLSAAAPPATLAAKSIALVMPACCDPGEGGKEKFSAALAQAGIAPGEVEILVQKPSADKVSLINSIRKVVAYDVAVVVVFGSSAAREAVKEARSIPIVFVGSYDPVKAGLVTSLDKPAANMTGIQCKTSLPFLLDAVQETSPITQMGVIYHSENLDSMTQLAELKELADKRGFKLTPVDVAQGSVDSRVDALRQTQYVFLAAGCYPDFANRENLGPIGKPIITQCPSGEAVDAVFMLAPDPDEALADTAKIAARIIKGEKPGQIAVGNIRKINFTINLAAAQKLGVKVPFSILNKATKIIK